MHDPRPHLWVFAGPNGAGKSTLVAKYLRLRLPIVNPDVIAANLSLSDKQESSVLEAGKIALRQRSAFLASAQSFAIETTLSGKSEIRLMHDAARAGYKVNLVFVGINSASLSQWRVNHRVSLGLHFVPSDDIVRRYPRSMENLATAMQLASRSLLVDNSGEGFRLLMIREEGRRAAIAKRLPSWFMQAVPPELRAA